MTPFIRSERTSPPGTAARSKTTGSIPALRRNIAVEAPASPPPTIQAFRVIGETIGCGPDVLEANYDAAMKVRTRALLVALLALGALGGSSSGSAGCCESYNVITPAWLPDGRSIVYAGVTQGAGIVALVSAEDGAELHKFAGATIESPQGTVPAVSRDGKTIVFVAFGLGVPSQLAVARIDGTHDGLLGVPADRTMRLALSPAGTTVAFVRPPSPDGPALALLDLSSGRVTDIGRGWEPAWSPRGDRLAFVRDGDIWVTAADGS